jgi:hypothetical protein
VIDFIIVQAVAMVAAFAPLVLIGYVLGHTFGILSVVQRHTSEFDNNHPYIWMAIVVAISVIVVIAIR